MSDGTSPPAAPPDAPAPEPTKIAGIINSLVPLVRLVPAPLRFPLLVLILYALICFAVIKLRPDWPANLILSVLFIFAAFAITIVKIFHPGTPSRQPPASQPNSRQRGGGLLQLPVLIVLAVTLVLAAGVSVAAVVMYVNQKRIEDRLSLQSPHSARTVEVFSAKKVAGYVLEAETTPRAGVPGVWVTMRGVVDVESTKTTEQGYFSLLVPAENALVESATFFVRFQNGRAFEAAGRKVNGFFDVEIPARYLLDRTSLFLEHFSPLLAAHTATASERHQPDSIQVQMRLRSIEINKDGTSGPSTWRFFIAVAGNRVNIKPSVYSDAPGENLAIAPAAIQTFKALPGDSVRVTVVGTRSLLFGIRSAVGSHYLAPSRMVPGQEYDFEIPVVVHGKRDAGAFTLRFTASRLDSLPSESVRNNTSGSS